METAQEVEWPPILHSLDVDSSFSWGNIESSAVYNAVESVPPEPYGGTDQIAAGDEREMVDITAHTDFSSRAIDWWCARFP